MTTMSVRLPDELHAKISELAEGEHISINTALVQGAQLWAEQRSQEARTRRLVKRIMEEDAGLLDRLADS